MELDASTILGIISLSSAGVAAGGAWIVSVEKRINGLKALHKTVQRVDRRTEKLSLFIAGRDVESDVDKAGV